MAFLTAFIQVAILFIIIITGYVLRKIGVLDLALTRGLSRLIVNLTLPCLAISSLQARLSHERLAEVILMCGIIVGAYAFYSLCAWFVPRLLAVTDSRDAAIYRYFMFFSNTGFMGYPVVEAFFGHDALFYAVIFNIPYPLLTFTVGVGFMVFGGKSPGEKRGIPWKTPGIWASIIGFALFLMPFRLPVVIAQPLHMLAGLTTPLSLIVIGSFLTQVRPAELWKGWRVYAGTAFRLIVIPALVYAGLRALGFTGLMLGVPVILSAMPGAANMSMLADQFGGNGELSSRLVFLSTFFSVFTLPFFALLVRF